jgi:hypothetical protein
MPCLSLLLGRCVKKKEYGVARAIGYSRKVQEAGGYVRCCLVIGIPLTRDSRRFREADMISSQLFSISLPSP